MTDDIAYPGVREWEFYTCPHCSKDVSGAIIAKTANELIRWLRCPACREDAVNVDGILASAHAQQGDLEEACAVGRQALAEVSTLRSKRSLDDVARLAQLVGASGSKVAHDFTEEAAQVLKSR